MNEASRRDELTSLTEHAVVENTIFLDEYLICDSRVLVSSRCCGLRIRILIEGGQTSQERCKPDQPNQESSQNVRTVDGEWRRSLSVLRSGMQQCLETDLDQSNATPPQVRAIMNGTTKAHWRSDLHEKKPAWDVNIALEGLLKAGATHPIQSTL